MIYLVLLITLSISVRDMLEQVILNRSLLILLTVSLITLLLNDGLELSILFGPVVCFAVLFPFYLFTNSLGGGDIKLFVVLGIFFNSLEALIFLFLAFLMQLLYMLFRKCKYCAFAPVIGFSFIILLNFKLYIYRFIDWFC